MLLGETSEEYATRRAQESTETWIKGFKPGETKIRILIPTSRFTTYREHFKRDLGFFPCGQDYKRDDGSRLFCPACSDLETDEKVKKRGRKWAFDGLDENGRHNVYKIGASIKKSLDIQENNRNRVLSAQDVIVIRDGKDLDTSYELEWQSPYPLENVPDEPHDIRKLITDAYQEALAAYGVDEFGNTEDSTPVEAGVPAQAQAPAAEQPFYVGPQGPQASKPAETPAAANEISIDVSDNNVELANLTAPELRAWLDFRGIEYPKADPKPRLLSRARDWTPF